MSKITTTLVNGQQYTQEYAAEVKDAVNSNALEFSFLNTVSSNSTDTSNSVLYTSAIGFNPFPTNGSLLKISAGGQFGANTNQKSISFSIAFASGSVNFNFTPTEINGGKWVAELDLVKSGEDSLSVNGKVLTSTIANSQVNSSKNDIIDFGTNPVFTLKGGGNSNDDVRVYFCKIKAFIV